MVNFVSIQIAKCHHTVEQSVMTSASHKILLLDLFLYQKVTVWRLHAELSSPPRKTCIAGNLSTIDLKNSFNVKVLEFCC